ncbi:MAG: S1-C subfamily serine protease [Akkermansiaceae bacterium]|jgi:S1-C subfamily serine protease|tara:strand:+ start:4290 stop:6422 length:2133 start_codon:yes stop_codon:yes gene_type:complete
MKHLLILPLLIGSLIAQTPRELDRTVRRLTPDLVEATLAIMLNGGSGSGVIVTPDGLVITAAHVTSEPGKQMKVLLADGRELPATSLGVDHETDGALLKINAPGPFPFRPYVKTKNYKIGDWAIATGHPGGPVVGRPSPVRLGRITEAGTKSGFSDSITSTAMVISGDSGGPLFNLKGEVIGINSNISGSWRVNKHVPLPAIIARWDALMNSESFGRPTQAQQQFENMFDEPYAELRDRFEEALKKHGKDDPAATPLLTRPRLLDPHHMQTFLDRWEPDPEADKAPRYGFTLEARVPRIKSIVPGSPAEKAGLSNGDVLTSVNGEAIASTVSLALSLRKGGELTLTTGNGKSALLKPEEVIARRHFPQPVAGVIDMMVTDFGEGDSSSDRIPIKEFQTSLNDLREKFAKSVVPLKNKKGRTLVSATVIHKGGQLLTKASEIEDIEGLTLTFEEKDYPVEIMAVDKDFDLALIRVNSTGLVPVDWDPNEPKVGQLILTPTSRGFLTGVITQPARVAPKKGFELNHTSEEPSAYLGVTFSPESTTPVIEIVEIGSPADKVGLLEGDEILEFEGSPVKSIEALAVGISKRSPGEKIVLVVKRGKDEVTLRPILDLRPPSAAGSFDRSASQRDGALSSLSARGGDLSKRRNGFPHCLYHDQPLSPRLTGTPLINLKGEVVGINIARALRHRSLAIPTANIDTVVAELRDIAKNR